MHDPEDGVQLRVVSRPEEVLEHDQRTRQTISGLDKRAVPPKEIFNRKIRTMSNGNGQVKYLTNLTTSSVFVLYFLTFLLINGGNL